MDTQTPGTAAFDGYTVQDLINIHAYLDGMVNQGRDGLTAARDHVESVLARMVLDIED